MGGRRTSEAMLAGCWAAGEWRGWRLRTALGEEYTLVPSGGRGGLAGPNFRDAVLERADGMRIRGDVELHLQPGGWYAHAHASALRYNDVVLHVTSSAGTRRVLVVPLASGHTARLKPRSNIRYRQVPLEARRSGRASGSLASLARPSSVRSCSTQARRGSRSARRPLRQSVLAKGIHQSE